VNRLLFVTIIGLAFWGIVGCSSNSKPKNSAQPNPTAPVAGHPPSTSVTATAVTPAAVPAPVPSASVTPPVQSHEPKPANGEPLAIIVNRKNPVDNLTFEELRKLCLGQHKVWADGGNVTIAVREKGQPEREAVLRQIYRMSESAFTRNVLQNGTSEEIPNLPKELSSAKHVCRFVFNVPGAIGFVRASEVDASVKKIHLDGLSVSDKAYKLRLPGQ
jgi:hypothetical protein